MGVQGEDLCVPPKGTQNKTNFWGESFLRKKNLVDKLVQTLCVSLREMGEKFCDIQTFLDQHPQASRLGDLPKAPIWYEIRNLVRSSELFKPQISLPSKHRH